MLNNNTRFFGNALPFFGSRELAKPREAAQLGEILELKIAPKRFHRLERRLFGWNDDVTETSDIREKIKIVTSSIRLVGLPSRFLNKRNHWWAFEAANSGVPGTNHSQQVVEAIVRTGLLEKHFGAAEGCMLIIPGTYYQTSGLKHKMPDFFLKSQENYVMHISVARCYLLEEKWRFGKLRISTDEVVKGVAQPTKYRRSFSGQDVRLLQFEYAS